MNRTFFTGFTGVTGLTTLGFCAALCAASPVLAASPFDGTWKTDMKTAQFPTKPDVFSVKNGIFSCDTCIPAIKIPADGKPHAVAGHAYYDMMTVKVVDPHTVTSTSTKGGKTTGMVTRTVSADGKTLMLHAKQTNIASGKTIENEATATRVAAGPAGSHAVSGSWKVTGAQPSAAAVTMTIKTMGDMVHVAYGTGESFEAKAGGPFVANMGDPGKTMSKIAMAGPRTWVETDMNLGKVNNVTTCNAETDGKTLACSWKDPRDGSTGSYKMMRQ